MGYPTNIEWADATWNPFGGCSVLSPGCTNCYAMKLAGTRLAHLPLYAGTTSPSKAGPVFNGTLTAAPDDHDVWAWPLRWKGAKQPKGGGTRSRIFVGDMSDLFHDDRSADDFHVIDRVFAVAAMAPQHDFLILTKRAVNMRSYVSHLVNEIIGHPWPLPNVWLGVSCEDQARADERVPHLLATPATVRFVSAEPLLGPIDFTRIHRGDDDCWRFEVNALTGFPSSRRGADLMRGEEGDGEWRGASGEELAVATKLDWIIAGGESAADARPMHPHWARDIRDQCAAAGIPFFFKQWGEWAPRDEWNPHDSMIAIKRDGASVPDDVAPQDVGGHRFAKVGKHAAGRTLDGVTHDARPR